MQRQAMLMYASCAWFYDDISGIETQQAMRHAARAIQLAQEMNEDGVEHEFIQRLAAAQSNLPEQGTGADVYRRHVEPLRVDLSKLAAHYAVSSAFYGYEDEAEIGMYRVRREDFRSHESGRSQLVTGRATARTTVTHESTPFYFAVMHLGDQTLTGGLNLIEDGAAYTKLAGELEPLFASGDFTAIWRHLDEHFRDEPLSLKSLFRDQQRHTIASILDPVLEEAEESYRHLYEEHVSLIRFLTSVGFPLPHRLSLASQVALDLALGHALEEATFDAAKARAVLEEAALAGIAFETPRLALVTLETLQRFAYDFEAAPDDPEALGRLDAAVGLLQRLPFSIDIGRVQNAFFRTVQRFAEDGIDLGDEAREKLHAIGEALKVRV
jgi:hypothetical protein